MSELSRLVWRYEAGYLLREKLRDRFVEHAEWLQGSMRSVSDRLRSYHEAQDIHARKGAAFDEFVRALERTARMERFKESLQEVRRAESALQTLGDTCKACEAMVRAEAQLSELENGLGGLDFPTVNDYRILMNRSVEFFRGEDFLVAAFIAEEVLRGLERLATVAAEEQPCPIHVHNGVERQAGIALALGELGLSSIEANVVRRGVEVVQEHIASRRFGLAAALLGDLEAANAPMETFLTQKRLAERGGIQGPLNAALAELKGIEERADAVWRRATTLLLEGSLQSTSLRMEHRALAASGNQ